MITAIPMNDDRVASHFTKADCLVFLDERGVEINRIGRVHGRGVNSAEW